MRVAVKEVPVKIGVAQMNTRAGDFAHTVDRMVEYSRQAAARGVRLLVFSMATLTGPVPVAEADQEGFFLDLSLALDDLAKRAKCACLVPVVVELDYDSVCEAMLVRDGQVVPLRLQSYFATQFASLVSHSGSITSKPSLGSDSLAGSGSSSESATGPNSGSATSPASESGSASVASSFSNADVSSLFGGITSQDAAGEDDEADDEDEMMPSLIAFELDGVRLGVALTYDDLDDFVDYDFDIDALIYIDSYGYSFDEPNSALGAALGESRYVADAQNMDAWLIGVGSLGGYGPYVFSGSSFAVAPWGELAALAPAFEESLMVADVALDEEGPLPHPLGVEVYNRTLYLWEALRLGLHDYLWKLGRSDVVLVLDGRIDSLVLSVLACDALGPTHVHALVPAALGDGERNCALELGRRLRIDVRESSIVPGTDELGSSHGSSELVIEAEEKAMDARRALAVDVAQAEAASIARELGGVLLSSFDKTYLALEVDASSLTPAGIMPLGDVYRSEILELARLRNTISPVIPEQGERLFDVPDIEGIDKVGPTNEIRLAKLDTILATHIEWAHGLTDTARHVGSSGFVARVIRRYEEHALGRAGRCLFLSVSTNTLFDVRVPLGLAWHDHVRDDSERISDEEIIAHLRDLAKGFQQMHDEASPNRSEEVHDVMNLLRDFVQGGSRMADTPGRGHFGQSGPDSSGTMSWGGPFSEN